MTSAELEPSKSAGIFPRSRSTRANLRYSLGASSSASAAPLWPVMSGAVRSKIACVLVEIGEFIILSPNTTAPEGILDQNRVFATTILLPSLSTASRRGRRRARHLLRANGWRQHRVHRQDYVPAGCCWPYFFALVYYPSS